MSDLIYPYVRDRNTLDRREFETRLRGGVLVYKYQKQLGSAQETLEFVGGREFGSVVRIMRREAHQYRAIRLRSTGSPYRVTVGRDVDCELVINHPAVSKHHAMVTVMESADVYVVDQRSRNGTFLNGQQLAPEVPRKLNGSDVLRFGDVDVTYFDATTFFDFLTSLLEPRLVSEQPRQR